MHSKASTPAHLNHIVLFLWCVLLQSFLLWCVLLVPAHPMHPAFCFARLAPAYPLHSQASFPAGIDQTRPPHIKLFRSCFSIIMMLLGNWANAQASTMHGGAWSGQSSGATACNMSCTSKWVLRDGHLVQHVDVHQRLKLHDKNASSLYLSAVSVQVFEPKSGSALMHCS